MKSFKNTVAAIALMIVMVTATFANAGLLLSDRSINTTPAPCTKEGADSGILVSDIVGILVVGLTTGGIIVVGRTAPDTTCTK